MNTSNAEAKSDRSELVPIDEVARCFGMRASAIRYYEERGLLAPASRHSGRRWYGAGELRRLAIIRYWQEAGLMGLDDIAQILAGDASTRKWREIVDEQVRNLQDKIDRMQRAKEFLEHVATHHDRAPDGCPHYEAFIWGPNSSPFGTSSK